ncbi:MAG: hypothetical protein RLZZ455_947 [Candidatus Parcubacteria bacterium]|jgi:hypothetical protein
MGRIFTWDEIQTNQVPTLEGITLAKRDVLSWGEEMIGTGAILGARLVGSSVRNPHRRGDVDVLLSATLPIPHEAISSTEELRKKVMSSHGVVLDHRFWEDEVASKSCTPRISYLMLSSEPIQDTLRGEDPLRNEVKADTTVASELASFALLHRNYFGKSLPYQNHRRETNLLHSSLDAVKKFGVMLMAAKGEGAGAIKPTGFSYLKSVLPDAVAESVVRVEELDRGYDAILDAAIGGGIGEEEYVQYVRSAESSSKRYTLDVFTYFVKPGNLEAVMENPTGFTEGQRGSSPMERR